jgi:predicted nucleotidyltransferase
MDRKAIEARRHAYRAALQAELGRLQRVLREVGAQEVYLFGSASRGEDRYGSDLDLLVVLESDLPFVERLALLYRQLLPRVEVDILAYTPAEFARLRESNPLVRRACQEGVRLL